MTHRPASEAVALRAAYDEQLRRDAEVPGAISTTSLGPLLLARYPRGLAFVTYQSLADGSQMPTTAAISEMVQAATDQLRSDDTITKIEWKTRGHDCAPGLHLALLAAGFVAGERESVMIGPAKALALDDGPPAGVTVRRADCEAEVIAAEHMAGAVFGDSEADLAASTERIVASIAHSRHPGPGQQSPWAKSGFTPTPPITPARSWSAPG